MDLKQLREFNSEFLKSFIDRQEGALFNLDSKELITKVPESTVQTIYFDPPFSSKNQNDIPHKQDRDSGDLSKFLWFIDKKKSFKDECEYYIREFHRVLNEQGSLFCHLPWELAYDIKPILDKVFTGEGCFKNEIIWTFRRWSDRSNSLQENHHTILWYTKSPSKYVFNKLEMPRAKSTIKRFGNEKIVSAVDKVTGKRVPSKTTGKSTTASLNDTWVWDDNRKNWLYELDEIDEGSFIENNRANWGVSHTAPVKKLKSLNEDKTYPFEKPKALIERLVKMSSDEGDTVLDFFAGTGVVGDVCKDLNRKYLLNEISHYTTLDIIKRLDYKILVPGLPLYNHFSTFGKTLDKISGRDFEFWAGYTLGGISDDSFRGRDSYHGLDIFVKADLGEFFPGEVKKKLTNQDEWYKIKSKTEKFFKHEKFKDFPRVFYIVTTDASKQIEYEIGKNEDVEFKILQLSSKRFSHTLSIKELEDFIKSKLIDDGLDKVKKAVTKKEKKKVAKKRS